MLVVTNAQIEKKPTAIANHVLRVEAEGLDLELILPSDMFRNLLETGLKRLSVQGFSKEIQEAIKVIQSVLKPAACMCDPDREHCYVCTGSR